MEGTQGGEPHRSSTSNQTAASKVFAIPELLEQILLDLAQITTAPAHEKLAPQLFVLQRVNCTFQATIARSRHLQQYMWLSPMPLEAYTTTDGDDEKCKEQATTAAIKFLCDILNLQIETFRPSTPSVFTDSRLRRGFHSRFETKTTINADYAFSDEIRKASWTRMRAVPFQTGWDVFWVFIVRETVTYEGKAYSASFLDAVRFDESWSLGEVFDEFERLTKSTKSRRVTLEANLIPKKLLKERDDRDDH